MARLPSLDGWRAVAIVLVLLSHSFYADAAPAALEALVPLGDLGVRSFFVLSGFLITFLLLGEARAHDGVSLERFYIRRALRILPTYAAYLAVLALLTAGGLYSDSASSWLGALTFTRNLGGQGQSATVHLWSLSIEEQFYLLWPFTLLTLRLWRRPQVMAGLLLALIVAAVVFRWQLMSLTFGGSIFNRIRCPKSAFAYMDSLAAGCLGACLAAQHGARTPAALLHRRLAIAAAILATAAAQIALYESGARAVVALAPAVQAVSFTALLWLTAFQPSGFLARALNWRPVALVGTWSYSLYVWQFLMLPFFMRASPGHWFQHWTVWWIGALAFALASYYGLERPMLRFRARFRPSAVADAPERKAGARRVLSDPHDVARARDDGVL